MAVHLISISDLLLVDGWAQVWTVSDKEGMNRILHSCGFNISKPIHFDFCEHRNLRNQVVSCERAIGTERTDGFWLTSGGASEQVKLEQCEGSMLKELATMSRRGITSAEVAYSSSDYNR